ncbi:MAG: Kinesin [Icmadophila ericetorum]|nr:Kinesin [Icmadophila ericetorum]
MYTSQRLQFKEVFEIVEGILKDMAIDHRVIHGIAAESRLKSSASSPSLRSRDLEVMTTGRNTPDAGGGNVRVVVRVRGFLPREVDRGAECLVEMDPNTQTTKLLAPNNDDPANARMQGRKVIEEKKFTFDNSFWSHNPSDPHYAHQEDVYNALGEEFLDHNFEGYHTCIFAYGQTGSGKSYTMMGTPGQPGLIPRTCQDLFERIESNDSPHISYTVRVSYFEVYNEHVRDLLNHRAINPKQPDYLKIREHPTEGPYVKDLIDVPVKNYDELLRRIRQGDNSRTTASTKMNDTSSRSHAVFTIMLKQIHHDLATDSTTERLARIRLVDLAGSERAKATGAVGTRLQEGANINKSLTTLGRVIAALADPRNGRGKGRSKEVVPYRDSILTWLLKDSLGGNSKTAMIACIAPSDYDETLSTLRYADQAKNIRTRAIVNQDSVSAAERDAQIAEMQNTIRQLQIQVSQANEMAKDSQKLRKENGNFSAFGGQRDEKLEEYQNKVEQMQRLMEEERLVGESKIRQLMEQNESLKRHLKLAIDSIRNPIPLVTLTPEDEPVEKEKEALFMPKRRQSTVSRKTTLTEMPPPSIPNAQGKVSKSTSPSLNPADKENQAPLPSCHDSEQGQTTTNREVIDLTDSSHTPAHQRNTSTDSGYYEEAVVYGGSPEKKTEEDAKEMQAHMQELLNDLGLFRRKIRDDRERFGVTGVGAGGRKPLGNLEDVVNYIV